MFGGESLGPAGSDPLAPGERPPGLGSGARGSASLCKQDARAHRPSQNLWQPRKEQHPFTVASRRSLLPRKLPCALLCLNQTLSMFTRLGSEIDTEM